jgi:PAS domain-containing protein
MPIINMPIYDPEHRVHELELKNEQLRNEVSHLSDIRHFANLFSLYEKGALKNLLSTENPLQMNDHDHLSILGHMNIMIAYWDKHLINCFANQAYAGWFGISPTQMRGMHIKDVIGDAGYHRNLNHINGVLLGEEQKFEYDFPSPDAEQVLHSLTEYIPDIADGQLKGFYVQVVLR